MKKALITLTLFIAITSLISSCYNDNEETLYRFVQPNCDTTNVTYSGTVSAIISGNCLGASCHSTGGSSGYYYDTYTGLKSQANNLAGRLTGQSGNLMPPTGKLGACQIDQIEAWVNEGAPNN